jgi:hypothetical protein
MAQNFGRRAEDIEIAVLKERMDQQKEYTENLEERFVNKLTDMENRFDKRCTKKEEKIDALVAFQNRTIGYMALASGIVTMTIEYFINKQ